MDYQWKNVVCETPVVMSSKGSELCLLWLHDLGSHSVSAVWDHLHTLLEIYEEFQTTAMIVHWSTEWTQAHGKHIHTVGYEF